GRCRAELESLNYEEKLHQLLREDQRLMVLTAENRAPIRGLPAKIPERFIDVGICEQTMIGVAAGLALRGRIPIVHALASFLTMRAFEFIRTDVGIPALPVKLVGGFSGFLSEANGPTRQALEDIALMRGIPNVNVWCPADRQELIEGLDTVVRDPAPYYIRYIDSPPAVGHRKPFAPGRAEVLCQGTDIAILCYGLLTAQCYEASRLLNREGLSVRLVTMRTLKPVDEDAIVGAAEQARLIVSVEDHFKAGGLYSITAEVLLRHGAKARVLPVALDGRWFRPALLNDVLAYEGFTAEALCARINAELTRLKE
ncbi:MAG: transketolase family protein, partial [Burkholderiales bacterium]